MARGKNSPALFEVIRNAQQKQREQLERDRQKQQQLAVAESQGVSPAAQLLRSPLYWFKGKHAHAAAGGLTAPVLREVPATPPVPPAATPTLPPEAQPPVIRETMQWVDVDQSTPNAFTPPAPRPAPTLPTFQPSSPAAEAARQVREELAAQEAPAAEPLFASTLPAYDDYGPAFDVHNDGDAAPAGPAAVPFNYTTAAIAGFAVIVTCAVLLVIATAGRHKTPAPAATALRPGALDVHTTSDSTDPTPTDDSNRASVGSAPEAVAIDGPGKPIPVPTNVKRVVGNQYLVLLSFPREDDAKDLVKFLAQNGVPATAEKALPDYAKSWTSVVTVRGFGRTKSNPAFNSYSAAISDLLQKYAGDSKFRKTFKLDVYKWRSTR